jgi:penicillin-binding protein 1A
MARQFAVEKLGSEAYNGGYIVHTTVDSHLQLVAQQAVWDGAVDYDKRHGYRGAEKTLSSTCTATTADNQLLVYRAERL